MESHRRASTQVRISPVPTWTRMRSGSLIRKRCSTDHVHVHISSRSTSSKCGRYENSHAYLEEDEVVVVVDSRFQVWWHSGGGGGVVGGFEERRTA